MWRSTLPGSTLSLKHKQETGICPKEYKLLLNLKNLRPTMAVATLAS
jgi:hypothetical protein